MHAKSRELLALCLLAITTFLSAFLLFQVQPLMGKYILPWFGGSPGVWTTCMLVFQVLLFAGYAYAHGLNRFVSPRLQPLIHCTLLAFAAATLPITPEASWKPTGDEAPATLIMWLLLAKIGMPYFLLSSTGPLLQSWIGRSGLSIQPYRLYALSNIGSLLALLSFPFVFEPLLPSGQQAMYWSLAFAAFAILCGSTGLFVASRSGTATASNAKDATPPVADELKHVAWSSIGAWFVLAMLPSIMLLATTNQACLDTAVIPFLWVIPIAIYLLTFILTFDSERWYLRRPYIMLSTLFFLAVYILKMSDRSSSLGLELFLYFGSLFFSCMVCHGELVRLKPDVRHLTMFYMTISAGGACGGLFVGLAAPLLFTGYFELQLGLFGCILLFMHIYLESNQKWKTSVPARGKGAIAVALLAAFLVWLTNKDAVSDAQLTARRNFYGVLSVCEKQDVVEDQRVRTLVHGRVVHGAQFQTPELKNQATTYYSPSSGVGLTLSRHKADQPRHVGVVGLGTGTLALYANAHDRFRFYEINPDVIELAQTYFTFLRDSAAQIETVVGDARLTLERETPQAFDVLVLDAFSGDAVPVHLLTREAMAIYKKHLTSSGVLAVHTSNLYFDLQSVVAGLAREAGLKMHIVTNADAASPSALTSCWVLLSQDDSPLQTIAGEANRSTTPSRFIIWTDDRSNLFEVLR